MKSTKRGRLAIMAAVMAASAVSAMANTAGLKGTVAPDSPYRQTASTVAATETGVKFQIAPIKMAAPTAAAAKPVTHTRWR